MEVPATTEKILGYTVPASGGAYFRILPYQLVRTSLRQAHDQSAPGRFYIRPWELHDWVPTVSAPRLRKVRAFLGRRGTWGRMGRRFSECHFPLVDQTVNEMVTERRERLGPGQTDA